MGNILAIQMARREGEHGGGILMALRFRPQNLGIHFIYSHPIGENIAMGPHLSVRWVVSLVIAIHLVTKADGFFGGQPIVSTTGTLPNILHKRAN